MIIQSTQRTGLGVPELHPDELVLDSKGGVQQHVTWSAADGENFPSIDISRKSDGSFFAFFSELPDLEHWDHAAGTLDEATAGLSSDVANRYKELFDLKNPTAFEIAALGFSPNVIIRSEGTAQAVGIELHAPDIYIDVRNILKENRGFETYIWSADRQKALLVSLGIDSVAIRELQRAPGEGTIKFIPAPRRLILEETGTPIGASRGFGDEHMIDPGEQRDAIVRIRRILQNSGRFVGMFPVPL
jgi:hypothetical protein